MSGAGPTPNARGGKKQVVSSQDQRRSMNQRRQATAQQIRKQRREEVFRSKRQGQSQAAATTISDSQEITALSAALDSFLQEGNGENLVQIQQVLASASATSIFLQRLITEDPAKASAFISQTVRHLVHQEEGIQSAALAVLLEISSTPSPVTAPEDYYGRPPPRWSDLLVDEPTGTLIPTLISFLSNSNTATVEHAVWIIGNLVQESPAALQSVRPSWPVLVAALPNTAYACAAVVRQDSTSYGMDFLQSLTVPHLTKLLQNNDTAVETAWMLEALSRREDAAVDYLCQTSEPITTLVQRLYQAAVSSKMKFLVPALQAIGNMLTSCEGRYVPLLLSNTTFVQSLSHLLEQGTVMDVIWVAGCCLCDAGIPGHAATDIAAATFLPRLVAILSSQSASLHWKRDAACAIWNAISDPPDANPAMGSPEHNSNQANQFLLDHVWSSTGGSADNDQLLQACIDLLKVPDMDAVLASLQVLDNILRSVSDSRVLFQGLTGVDALEAVCSNAVGRGDSVALDMASLLAETLLDDFFDSDDAEDEGEDISQTAPAVRGNQFVFGAPLSPASSSAVAPPAFNFNSDSAGQEGQGRGRGRGRTLPAWMQSSK
jgi:hypothetical protein